MKKTKGNSMSKFIFKTSRYISGGLVAIALLTGSVHAACFTVYSPQNKILYSGRNTPVNLSRQLHETLPVTFPGGYMVFALDTDDCQEIDTRNNVETTASAPNSTTVLNNSAKHHASRANYSTSTNYSSGANYSPSTNYSSGTRRNTPGTEVYVHGYTRDNGTYVQPHTRSAPHRRR